ncbi:MAG TPA: M12 family metallo-peptidase [Jiangellales bacterium]|nr:M12 family metallo-peptidase [Jiangellales bacterium]
MTGSGGRPRGLRRRTGALMALLVAGTMVMIDLPASANQEFVPGEDSTEELWSHVRGTPPAEVDGKEPVVVPEEFRSFRLNRAGLEEALEQAPLEEAAADLAETAGRRTATASAAPALELALPKPDGGFERFAIEESPILEAGLAAANPDIATYAGRSLDDPARTVRADLTSLGFHASVRGPGGSWYVEPHYHLDQSLYVSYYAANVTENPHGVFVEKEDAGSASVEEQLGDLLAQAEPQAAADAGPEVQLRIYRLALLSDPTYSTYFGGPQNVLAAKVTMMNRVNQIYEDESAIRMILIDDNDKIALNTAADMTGANGPCGSAPCFTAAQASGCGGGTLGRNRIVIGQLIGAANYDVGHIIFGLSGGGVASLNSVGGNAKAQGCTGLPNPVGDFFAVDYVAHEIGHQFGSNHTFNGSVGNCSGGNRSGANSVEPGSGSSIMAYAGICGRDNLQPHTDPYWSQRSYQVIDAFVTSDRPAINEVQTVSLRDFDTNGDSFRLRYDQEWSAPIVRGTNYTTAAIQAALQGLPDWPAGGVATVAAWGGTGGLNDFGFQVTFSGTLAATDVPMLQIEVEGGSGFVGDTAKGGPVDNQGHVVTATGNHAPVVEPLTSYTIPYRTPFALTGGATDADGDTVTYMWEQNNIGTAAVALANQVKTTGPLFRQFGTALDMTRYDPREYDNPGTNSVTTDPTRIFPDMAQILAGNTNAKTGVCPDAVPPTGTLPASLVDCLSEFLPTSAYPGPMDFRLTARDGNPGAGGIGSADTVISLAPGSGPFLVTSQSAGATLYGGSTQTVTWDVAGTDAAPIGTSDVRISLSDDGGLTYPYVLAAATPNDGSADVTLPNAGIERARIKVEAVGNVFFAVNEADLAISAVPVVTNDAPGGTATVQYSDALSPTVTVSATDPDSPGSALTAVATGLPAGLSLTVGTTSPGTTVPGTRTWTVTGNVTAAPGSYPVTVTVTDEAGGEGTTSFTIVVQPEDAGVTYTGDTVVYAAPGAATATVSLRATLRDSSLLPLSGDSAPGDIRNATVTFAAGGTDLCGPVAVGAALVGSTTTGSGTCTAELEPGTYTVAATAGSYYTGTTTATVRVIAADGGSVTGTGEITATSSAGTYAATPGSRVGVELSVRYAPPASTRLSGNATVSLVSGGVSYELRSTSLDALGTTRRTEAGAACSAGPSQVCWGIGTVRATADLVNRATGATVKRGLELRITFTDRGAPGRNDTLGVTVWDGSTLVHSSAWTGAATAEQALTGGNLNVQ